jgi:putative transposase
LARDEIHACREALLDMFVFQSLLEVRDQTEKWLKEYNDERAHDSLHDMTTREYLLTKKTSSRKTLAE